MSIAHFHCYRDTRALAERIIPNVVVGTPAKGMNAYLRERELPISSMEEAEFFRQLERYRIVRSRVSVLRELAADQGHSPAAQPVAAQASTDAPGATTHGPRLSAPRGVSGGAPVLSSRVNRGAGVGTHGSEADSGGHVAQAADDATRTGARDEQAGRTTTATELATETAGAAAAAQRAPLPVPAPDFWTGMDAFLKRHLTSEQRSATQAAFDELHWDTFNSKKLNWEDMEDVAGMIMREVGMTLPEPRGSTGVAVD